MMSNMHATVVDRSGTEIPVDETQVYERVQALCDRAPPLLNVDTNLVVSTVLSRLHRNMTTRALDELTARTCATKATVHPEYGILGARVLVSDLQKSIRGSFSETTARLVESKALGHMDRRYAAFVERHGAILDAAINHAADYTYNYFGLRTLLRAYLLRIDGEVVETPQYMLMRVATFLHAEDEDDEDPRAGVDAVLAAYRKMSDKLFTHATPTLFNAGGEKSQLLSCFLMGVGDSIEGIYDAMKSCALISKYAGGIGVHIQAVRANNSLIRSMGGKSSGIGPMCRVFEATALHVNQAGRRNGSFAMYLPPWHADIETFLRLKRHQGAEEEERARTLHYGLWVSDRFMRAVQANTDWHLFCPDECPDLLKTHGTPAFDAAYESAVHAGKARRVVKARHLFKEMLVTQIETGQPYVLFADAANRKSNQQNLGPIRSSNLCAEIIEYSDDKEYACCTLGSISLPGHVRYNNARVAALTESGPVKLVRCRSKTCLAEAILRLHGVPFDYEPAAYAESRGRSYGSVFSSDGTYVGGHRELTEALRPEYDFKALHDTTRQLVRNLERAIDRNFYPTKETERSNFRHRPLGIGVQGLSDVFNQMRYPYDSPEAAHLNTQISAVIYYAAMLESAELAKTLGPYSSFDGSPLSRGIFQFDLWKVKPISVVPGLELDWESLRSTVMESGARHSLLTAYMPTASTSQILGNNECFEPRTTNIYRRETSAGSFIVVNPHCVRFLQCLDLWDEGMKNRIIANRGSLVGIQAIPKTVQAIFRTAWDVSMRAIIDLSAGRGPYVCQSQSLNHYVEQPTVPRLSSALFHAWRSGLKTGCYYLHTRAVAETQAVTIVPTLNTTTACESCQG